MDGMTLLGIFIMWIVAGLFCAMVNHIIHIYRDN